MSAALSSKTPSGDCYIAAMANDGSTHNPSCTPRPFPEREVSDVVGGIERMLLALARRFRDGYADTISLEDIRRLDAALAAVKDEAVSSLRDQGYPDRQIGEALGVTQQAVSKRWRREQP
ncbi:MAG TPA: hypothetical protein VGG82_07830 [Casimicrobiaceae bacterium]|jgi:hypothetical protein